MTWLTGAGNEATGAAEGNTSTQPPVQRQQRILISWFQKNQFHKSTNFDMYARWLQQCPLISELGGFSQILDPTEEQLVVGCGNYLAERVGPSDLKEASLFLDVTGPSGNGDSLCNEDDLSSHGFVVAKWVLLWMTGVSGMDVCAEYNISLVITHALYVSHALSVTSNADAPSQSAAPLDQERDRNRRVPRGDTVDLLLLQLRLQLRS